jgi:hypothetical protein
MKQHDEKKSTRAQAALEFLTTYGWAFIVILTAIGALAYFGVLKVDPPDRCTIGSEMICYDFLLSKEGTDPVVTLVIGNAKDFTMNITDMDCIFPDNSEQDADEAYVYPISSYTPMNPANKIIGATAGYPGGNFAPGDKRYIDCYGAAGTGGLFIGQKAKVQFTIKYVNQDIDGFTHSIQGEVVAEVQG